MGELVKILKNSNEINYNLLSTPIFTSKLGSGNSFEEEIISSVLLDSNHSYQSVFGSTNFFADCIGNEPLFKKKKFQKYIKTLEDNYASKQDNILVKGKEKYYLVDLESVLQDDIIQTQIIDRSLNYAKNKLEAVYLHNLNGGLMILNGFMELFHLDGEIRIDSLIETIPQARESCKNISRINQIGSLMKLEEIHLDKLLKNYSSNYEPRLEEKLVYHHTSPSVSINSSMPLIELALDSLVEYSKTNYPTQIELSVEPTSSGARIIVSSDSKKDDLGDLAFLVEKSDDIYTSADDLLCNHILLREIEGSFYLANSPKELKTVYLDLKNLPKQ